MGGGSLLGFFPSEILVKFNNLGDQLRKLISRRSALRAEEKKKISEQIKQLREEQDTILSENLTAKPALLQRCRSFFPEEVLTWFDAAVVLGGDDPKYPPLLGTGGNDGRLDFTNNFMQRLCSLLDMDSGHAMKESLPSLKACMFADIVADLPRDMAIGQFSPSCAGGANMVASYDAKALNNSWDFIFMIEGALLFASALSRRHGAAAREMLSFPFAFYPSSAGYGSAALTDESNSRAEQWVPIWQKPATHGEVLNLFAEGRAQVGRYQVARGVDFARALATLGTDRGIGSFQRYSFQERNGLAYLAVDLGKWNVVENEQISLLMEVERWIDALRRAAKSPNAPASLGRHHRILENAVMNSVRGTCSLGGVLMALGGAEEAILHSPRTATDAYLRPLPRLSVQWVDAVNDGSPEFRLACSLASIQGAGKGDSSVGPLRSNMVPYNFQKPNAAFDKVWMDKSHIVWGGGSLVSNLIAVLRRRCMDATRYGLPVLPLEGRNYAQLPDVVAFIEGHINERLLESHLWGLNAINWRDWNPGETPWAPLGEAVVSPAYAFLKLTHATLLPDGSRISNSGLSLPFDPGILAAASAGRCAEATRRAAQRLRVSGWTPLVSSVVGSADHARRCAAAALFPVRESDLRALSEIILRHSAGKSQQETKSAIADQ